MNYLKMTLMNVIQDTADYKNTNYDRLHISTNKHRPNDKQNVVQAKIRGFKREKTKRNTNYH